MPATTAETLSLVTRNVSVAPLVLLSAADHYSRSAKGTRKRVVGVLLGQNNGANVRVSNSFAGKCFFNSQIEDSLGSYGSVFCAAVLTEGQFLSRKTMQILVYGI